jgi:hydrogenase maturation factor HypE
MFELYNLVSIIQSDRPVLGDIRDRIASLSYDVQHNFDETFMSKRKQGDTGRDDNNSPKRSRVSHGEGGSGLRRGGDVYHDRQVVDAFTRAGYTLESNDEDENGLAPLNQVKQSSTPSVNLN